jgi:hypothetical protein
MTFYGLLCMCLHFFPTAGADQQSGSLACFRSDVYNGEVFQHLVRDIVDRARYNAVLVLGISSESYRLGESAAFAVTDALANSMACKDLSTEQSGCPLI